MSVIKEVKKQVLGLKVGDNLYQIAYKMGIMPTPESEGRYDMPKTDHLNVDERTKNEFLLINSAFISKVNENYALIVKVRQINGNIMIEQNERSSYDYTVDFLLEINYFVIGIDDSGKTFIHYLDSERNKRVRVHGFEFVVWYHEMNDGEVLNHFMEQNPEIFNKYKDFTLDQILDYMNRTDAGFTRIQGDLVYKLVEGHIGFCQACPSPRPSPSGKTFLNPTHGEPKMLYKIEPALNNSQDICIDCIKHLNRNHRLVSRQQMGNHILASELEQFIEIGDSFTFNTPTIMSFPDMTIEDVEKFKDSLKPGYMVLTKNDKMYMSIEAPSDSGPKIEGIDYLQETARSMWASTGRLGQPNIIVALGGQNVILEHREHESKSLYIPKNSIGVFTFQRTAPEVVGAE